jgi:AraC-like DNA-binding protein
MMELLSVLLREGLQKKDASPHEHAVRYYGVVEPALRHIRDAYTEQISIEELAALCNVSKYHFCRIFKSVAGSTAIQYLNEYRLQIAHILLLNTKENIAQIAQKCGFESENYFCRYYKRQFGVSPGKARNIQ